MQFGGLPITGALQGAVVGRGLELAAGSEVVAGLDDFRQKYLGQMSEERPE
jgi:hypothetical protein